MLRVGAMCQLCCLMTTGPIDATRHVEKNEASGYLSIFAWQLFMV